MKEARMKIDSLASVIRSEPEVAKPSGAAQHCPRLRTPRVPRSGPVHRNSDVSNAIKKRREKLRSARVPELGASVLTCALTSHI